MIVNKSNLELIKHSFDLYNLIEKMNNDEKANILEIILNEIDLDVEELKNIKTKVYQERIKQLMKKIDLINELDSDE